MKKFLELIPNHHDIDFTGKFKVFIVLSMAVSALSVASMFFKGFNFGIDFTGGTVVQIKFNDAHPIGEVRKVMEDLGAHEASVVAMDEKGSEYLITARAVHHNNSQQGTLPKQILDKVGADKAKIVHADIVGPKVGSELKASALRSLLYTLLIIMVYIWFRFDFKFAPGATTAMIHDMTIAGGYYVVTQHEFDITAVAALLTIAGYSVNDTIVVYDRVREMLKGGATGPLEQTVNKAINLTLSRTIITSGATFITVVPIAIFCEGPIKDFAQTMLLGIFVGTYSTYYIAAPMTIYVEKFLKKRAPKTGRVATV